MKKLVRFCAFWLCSLVLTAHASLAGTVNDLVGRLIPAYADRFVFEPLSIEEGSGGFSLKSQGDKIVIAGTDGVAQAAGLNYYLENYCKTQVTINMFPVVMPKELPLVEEEVFVTTPYKYRYFFNYCTFGYTMPWWDWSRWEKMIDYMALKGINMPLSIIGQEAVWYDVYKELGLSDAQMDEFFVGPAHLPWGWMGNIDGIGGPLPKAWYAERVALQQKILKRQREFGMKAVLQAFTGHVPKALVKLYPDAQITKINDWAGIEGTMFLSPSDPLFNTIGTMFLKRQTELFGTDHYYDADCFIEVDPPSNDPKFLKDITKGVYETMSSVDPDAVWVIQGWFLLFRNSWWTEEPTKAFFSGAPQGKMLVLDLNAEYAPVWDKHKAFHGQDWIWGALCGGDQKINMGGNLKKIQHELARAEAQEGKKGLRGIGVIPEGVGYNDPVYDFIFGKAWKSDELNTQDWIGAWAKRRYSTSDDRAAQAWQLIEDTIYNHNRARWTPILGTPHLINQNRLELDMRVEAQTIQVVSAKDFGTDFDVPRLAQGAEILLSLSDVLADHETYRFDLVNVFRELIRAFYNKNLTQLSRAYAQGDVAVFDKAAADMLRIYQDLEAICATQPRFMVGPWIEDARSWGRTEEEKDYYERNARSIITTWQPYENATLRDYASRQWSGLMADYYIPRWTLFCQQLRACLVEGKEFNAGAFYEATKKMDFEWTLKKDKYPTVPEKDTVEVIQELWDSYYKEVFKKAV